MLKNPLQTYVPIEEREDGIYIKVDSSLRDSMQLAVILNDMRASAVLNFEEEKFKDVFTRARGGFEKIGPLFEYYDEEFDDLILSTVTAQKAVITVPAIVASREKALDELQIMRFLKRKGVVYGIDKKVLTQVLLGVHYNHQVAIANAIPPINGTDARIELKITLAPERKPGTRQDGSADYRNIQTFTPVVKGDTLAIKIPAGIGTPGVAVTGEPIPAQPGNDITLPKGRNTEISVDGLQLTALVTGIVFYENGLLTITEMLHVESDVDFSVGNIKYVGDVVIDGSVKPGFVVEAEGSIEIKGSVESAQVISRGGSVKINNGIVGKGDTFITAKENIVVCFAQNATFVTEGTITLEKHLLHCSVTCGVFEGTTSQCSVIGGEIKAARSIILKSCGSEKGIPTKMTIYDKNKYFFREKRKELEELKGKVVSDMEPVEKQLRTKMALLKKAGDGVSERSKEEIKKWVDIYNEFKKKLGYIDVKIKELDAASKNPSVEGGFISVPGSCFPGVEITLYDLSLPVKNLATGKRFSIRNGLIAVEG